MDLQKLTNPSSDQGNSPAIASNVPPPRRRWITRIALPALIVLATAALILYAARDVIRPATEVMTTRAVAVNLPTGNDSPGTPAAQSASRVVAQAPGWVEPDPYPVYASGLANGVVKTVHVLEGESVKADQILVELIDDDAKLALATAQADLAQANAVLAAAQADLKEPIALQRAEAMSLAQVEAKQAALTRLDAEVDQQQARLEELNAAYDRLAKLSEQSVSKLQIEEAKYRAQSQRAAVKAIQQRRPELEAELATVQAAHTAAKRDLELKIQLKRIDQEAIAARDAAQVRVAEAELRLQRMTITSPVDGVVMARLVGPGSKVMLDMDAPHSAHVIHLYDPASLQVRVDVPLADAAKVGLNQRAEIVVDVLPDRIFEGRVTRLVHQADIAKNTVQFKVAIADPSALLKPDMLARVKFFGIGGSDALNQTSASTTAGSPVAIQSSAVVKQGDQHYVWWVSPTTGRIEQRDIVLGDTRNDGSAIITQGLNPGDLVVDQPDATLKANQRVRYAKHAHGSR